MASRRNRFLLSVSKISTISNAPSAPIASQSSSNPAASNALVSVHSDTAPPDAKFCAAAIARRIAGNSLFTPGARLRLKHEQIMNEWRSRKNDAGMWDRAVSARCYEYLD